MWGGEGAAGTFYLWRGASDYARMRSDLAAAHWRSTAAAGRPGSVTIEIALGALACALWMDWEWDPRGRVAPDSVLAKGVDAAARALTLDSTSSDAWMAQAYIAVFRHPRTMDGVEAAFRRPLRRERDVFGTNGLGIDGDEFIGAAERDGFRAESGKNFHQ